MKHSPTVTGLRCRFTRATSSAARYWRMGFTASPISVQARMASASISYVARASRLCGTGVGGFFSMLFVN